MKTDWNRLKSIYESRYLKRRLFDMTYVLGARCRNGVVLVADKRGTRGTTPVITKKIEKIGDLGYFAFAGVEPTYTTFKLSLVEELEKGEAKTFNEKLQLIKELVREINQEESDIQKSDETFELFYARHNESKKAELYHIDIKGRAGTIVSEHAIGTGAPYGEIFLKTMAKLLRQKKEDTVGNIGGVGVLIARAIETFRLDTSVGDGSNCRYLYDDGTTASFNSINQPKTMAQIDNAIKLLGEFLTEKIKFVDKEIK